MVKQCFVIAVVVMVAAVAASNLTPSPSLIDAPIHVETAYPRESGDRLIIRDEDGNAVT